jgi:hypothetical protein
MITFSQGLADLPNNYPVADWWSAHWHTQVIELVFYFGLLFWAFRKWWVPIPLSVFVNVVTHPALWYLFPYWEPDSKWLEPLLPASQLEYSHYFAWLVIAETCVFLVEGHIVAVALSLWGREKYRRTEFALGWGILVAFIANVPSTLWGLLS